MRSCRKGEEKEMSTLISMVTFGNLRFTKLALRGIRETVTKPYSLFMIVGKPGDKDTEEFLTSEGIPHKSHTMNMGFPVSLNDIYDYAWKENNFDNLVTMGNVVIPYPYAIDSLIEVADTTDNEWLCAREWDVRALCKEYPELRAYFPGENYNFTRTEDRPWDVLKSYSKEISLDAGGLSDVHNLALFKKSVFDKIGYIDANFYPAYYEDNDYVRRAVHANLKSATVRNAIYFHFWSQTIKQEKGASDHEFFRSNREFYITKWNGDFGQEKWDVPFNGTPFELSMTIILQPSLCIDSRKDEKEIVYYWRFRHVARESNAG
jgi:GT2 family glycosyltransferase